ncbi:MAG: hypothetical protein V4667_11165 [Bacteroidota bacterium]
MIPDDVKVLSTETVAPYIVSLCDDGILYVRVTTEVEETVERSKKLVKTIGKMVNNKKVPLLSKFDEFVMPPKENRDFWSKKDSCPYTSAEAFITNSVAMKIIANFYMRIEKPQRVTKMFTDTEEARKWLKTFL